MNTIVVSFGEYLSSQARASRVTVKNYLADVNKFIRWFESTYNKEFEPSDLTPEVIKEFSGPDFSPASLERYVSTLRRFASFLDEKNLIASNPFSQGINNKQSTINSLDPWQLKAFKNYLYVNNASKLTRKNYLVDIAAFTSWLEDNSKSINVDAISQYKDTLLTILNMSPSTVDRKMSSIRKYLKFQELQHLTSPVTSRVAVSAEIEPTSINLDELNTEPFTADLEPFLYSRFPPLRLIQRIMQPYLAVENWTANIIALRLHHKRLKKMTSPMARRESDKYK